MRLGFSLRDHVLVTNLSPVFVFILTVAVAVKVVWLGYVKSKILEILYGQLKKKTA